MFQTSKICNKYSAISLLSFSLLFIGISLGETTASPASALPVETHTTNSPGSTPAKTPQCIEVRVPGHCVESQYAGRTIVTCIPDHLRKICKQS